ncbi:hypothetical protein [Mucilaginibacter sp. OK283]|jgi:hypothetical protein|uniref:hypothetical protein n=1 Tax=Mucilaginibacter sp. OK283 TaxID=1881049 RepID=UPI0008BA2F08|nr:hypothetical protein [Mucilaginibacter sp. OK283]SEP06087.1 hypothetical protein SAMN05428947_106179 [Mucilaginibacter sp. OK283]
MDFEQLTPVLIEGNVGETLDLSALSMLPEALRNDQLVRWLVNFTRENTDNFGRRDNERPEDFFVKDLLKDLVAENVKFYYAVLFHIGRRLKVAALADETIMSALETGQLRDTVANNPMLSGYNPQVAAGVLREMLLDAKKEHARVADQNYGLWLIWREEVADFESAVFETSRRYNEQEYDRYDRDPRYGRVLQVFALPGMLLKASFRNKQLNQRMSELGFNVQVSEPSTDLMPMALLQLAAMPDKERYGMMDLLREYNISKGLDVESLRRQREQQLSASMEHLLVREFGDKDPFEAYTALGKTADEHLAALYAKCELPGGNRFFYAERWLKGLVKDFYYYYENQSPKYKPAFDQVDFVAFARSADSSIKRSWVQTYLQPSISTKATLQTIFELNWIEPMVIAIQYQNQQQLSGWNLASVTQVIEMTVKLLNELGYGLYTPAEERLAALWKAAEKETYRIKW